LPGLYSDDILDRIARANDIVQLVSGYFPLKRAGKDYQALCPFHAEKTPSFTVSPNKQIFKCFGCGKGGGVFNFVMANESVTFPEAVRILAERAGIELEERPEARQQTGQRRQVRDVMVWATKAFAAGLKHPKAGAPGREYLERRGIKDETVEAFQIGYAPDGWDNLIRAAQRDNMPLEMLEAGGLVVKRDDGNGYYDRFRGRLMFPILDPLTRPIAFGGRIIGDGQPKYLNSPETVLFHKGEALYGLPQARDSIEKERRAVVVEGYFDVVMPWQEGVRNVVATLGTALTGEHIRNLKRHADDVVLVYDSDVAGQRAADRGVELFLAEDVRILVSVVPQGKDPCDFCRDQGGQAFRDLLAGAVDAFKFKWEIVRAELDAAGSPAAQQRALEAMLASVVKAPALAREDLRLQRDLILGHMSKVLGIGEETLRAEMARLRRPSGRSAAGTEVGANLPASSRRGRRGAAEWTLMAVLVCRPSRLEAALKAVPPDRIVTPDLRRLYEAILANPSRKDGDIESIVMRLEDPDLASLAVRLFEWGEEKEDARPEADTGPGPLARMFQEVTSDFLDLERDADLTVFRKAARESKDTGDGTFKAYMEARSRSQGVIPPGLRKPENAEP